MKLVGLHALLHIDDKDHAPHCTICDHATGNNLTPTITPNLHDFNIENTTQIVRCSPIKNYTFISRSPITLDQLFSRPPPFLL